MQIRSKLPHVGTTIFTTMSGLARECGAINLSQGFPDFDCAPRLAELASHYISNGYNQYAPLPGAPALRERIAAILQDCYQASYDIDREITVTAGATQAIYTALAAFVHPGDEVIVFEPAYDCYVPSIELHGGKAVVSQLSAENFSINWDDVRSKISNKTRAIVINSPHNPTGTVLSAEDLGELEKLVAGTDILVISDEVYEHMVFDGQVHHSICGRPALRSQSLVVSSFGKTIHTTGWKIGYVAAPADIMAEFRKVHQFNVFVVNHPLQLSIADFLADKNNYRSVKTFYQEKRDLFQRLTEGSRLKALPCAGTYFQLMSYAEVSDENDLDFAIRLTREKKLAAIPVSVFYTGKSETKLLRFCFAKKNETLEIAAGIIRSI